MKIFLVIGLLAILAACNNASPKKENQNNASIPLTLSDSLYKEVMQGHDTAMLQIGPLTRYKALVKQQADSLVASKSVNQSLKKSLSAAADSLNKAEEMMNNWMVQFDPEKAGQTEAQKVDFFTKEKEKVDDIKNRIANSIKLAKETTGK